MELMIALVLGVSQLRVDWNPKEIRFPEDSRRIQFPFFMPKNDQIQSIDKMLLVWVPKLDEFPGRRARQALRITLRFRDQKILELFQTPNVNVSPEENIGQIIGQGYLGFSMQKGASLVVVRSGSTCLGFVSRDFDVETLRTIASTIEPYRSDHSGWQNRR